MCSPFRKVRTGLQAALGAFGETASPRGQGSWALSLPGRPGTSESTHLGHQDGRGASTPCLGGCAARPAARMLHLTGLHVHQRRPCSQAPRAPLQSLRLPGIWGGPGPRCSRPSVSSHATPAVLEILIPMLCSPPAFHCHPRLTNTRVKLPSPLRTPSRSSAEQSRAWSTQTEGQREHWGGCPEAWQVREAAGSHQAWKYAGCGTPGPRRATPDSGCRLKPGAPAACLPDCLPPSSFLPSFLPPSLPSFLPSFLPPSLPPSLLPFPSLSFPFFLFPSFLPSSLPSSTHVFGQNLETKITCLWEIKTTHTPPCKCAGSEPVPAFSLHGNALCGFNWERVNPAVSSHEGLRSKV